ncbi:MAG: ribbon-helix-helix domain-containing protein [Dehalococcoidia bacterium]
MKRRLSILVDERVYEGLERRAEARGTSVSELIRCVIDDDLAKQPMAPPDANTNPNQGLLDLMKELAALDTGTPDPGIPSAGDPDFKRWLRDSMVADRLQHHRG